MFLYWQFLLFILAKKERKNKFPKFYERNDPKSFEHLILNGIVLPNNEQKRSTVVHKDFFNGIYFNRIIILILIMKYRYILLLFIHSYYCFIYNWNIFK